ncbi:hypothetical protein BU14_0031s0008 [Porphyra umbilicalis]|uniref:Uncharacterized protein n=1 Tax=Porphyra umbilicalis TaxID=2786 RepID=A0A1X6PJ44_PORUM|nr:hypothetical protein BU14_0031s0008 [Porphyra umbilicalis]|eukprot:OSX80835.1 hypothetical protein BU14_0031s0008 [Porphyra umbilicalis]
MTSAGTGPCDSPLMKKVSCSGGGPTTASHEGGTVTAVLAAAKTSSSPATAESDSDSVTDDSSPSLAQPLPLPLRRGVVPATAATRLRRTPTTSPVPKARPYGTHDTLPGRTSAPLEWSPKDPAAPPSSAAIDVPAVTRPTASDPPAVSVTATSTYAATGRVVEVGNTIGAAVRVQRYRPVPTLTAVSPAADTSGWRPPDATDASPQPLSAESSATADDEAPPECPPAASSSNAGGVTATHVAGGRASSLRVNSAARDRTAATPADTVGMRIHECVAAVRHEGAPPGAPSRVPGGRHLRIDEGAGAAAAAETPSAVNEAGPQSAESADVSANAAATPDEESVEDSDVGLWAAEAARPSPPSARGGTAAILGVALTTNRSMTAAGVIPNAPARSATDASASTSSSSRRGGPRGAACMMCGS